MRSSTFKYISSKYSMTSRCAGSTLTILTFLKRVRKVLVWSPLTGSRLYLLMKQNKELRISRTTLKWLTFKRSLKFTISTLKMFLSSLSATTCKIDIQIGITRLPLNSLKTEQLLCKLQQANASNQSVFDIDWSCASVADPMFSQFIYIHCRG